MRVQYVEKFSLARTAAGGYAEPAARARLRKLRPRACSACLVLQNGTRQAMPAVANRLAVPLATPMCRGDFPLNFPAVANGIVVSLAIEFIGDSVF